MCSVRIVYAASALGPLDGSIALATVARPYGWPIRFVSQRVMVGGVALTVHVVEPLRDRDGLAS